MQRSFGFEPPAQKALRAVHMNANDAARAQGIGMIPHFRVPRKSVIYRAFEEELPFAVALEDLGWWESSDGAR